MTSDTIRTALQTKMLEVTGIGSVLDYVVWTDDWQFIYDNFRDAALDRVHVWFIGLSSSLPATIFQGVSVRSFTYNIIGYYSLKTVNKSSQDFESVIKGILRKFDSKTSIGTNMQHGAPALIAVSNTIFSQHPAHTAQIQLTVEIREALATGLCA